MKRLIKENPWIWIAVPFCCMLGVLAAIVVIAEKNKPAEVPLAPPPGKEAAR